MPTRSLLWLSAVVLAWMAAPPAASLTLVPDPVPIDEFGIVGSIDLVDVVIGLPAGGMVGDGAVGGGDTTLVFEASVVESAPFDAWTILALTLFPTAGGGAIPVTGVGLVGASTNLSPGDIVGGGDQARFLGSVLEGSVSDRFFVSFASPLATDGSLELTIFAGEGVTFAMATALLVPEPSMVWMLAFAIGFVGLAQLRRSRSGV